MIDLATKKCEPCTAKTPKLDEKRIALLLKSLPQWSVKNGRLVRALGFKDFLAAMAFVKKVADLAESEQHHPDISIHDWNKVDLSIWTHAIGGFSENDFVLAAKIDLLGAK